MLPKALSNLIADAPALRHLSESANEDAWGRSEGFPIVFVDTDGLDDEAFMELSDSYGDALYESDVVLFDEESWRSKRYSLIAILGVFDDPDSEELGDAFPYVDQMDGLLLWDADSEAVFLLDGEASVDGDLGDALVCVAKSADALVPQIS